MRVKSYTFEKWYIKWMNEPVMSWASYNHLIETSSNGNFSKKIK